MGAFMSRKMNYFMVIMEVQNFAKAAEILCVTRSPLSKTISEIEFFLGGQLFHRKHNKLEPTDLAWEYYNQCKPIYNALINLEKKCSPHKNRIFTLKLDISLPQLLANSIAFISQSENLNVKVLRDMITVNDVSALTNESDTAIISLRPLSGADLVHSDSWEGSNIMLLSATSSMDSHNKNNIFVWNESNHQYVKNKFFNFATQMNIDPVFIEHNYDIGTLFYMVKAGKGMVISSEKFAGMYKMDGIKWQRINNLHTRCYIYHSDVLHMTSTLNAIKKILSQLI